MSMQWIREQSPSWDAGKASIIGDAPQGIFELGPFEAGQVVPGEWWRVQRDGRAVGYGWMDIVWGDGEILLAVEPSAQGQGVGGFILEKLVDEARARGLEYVYNTVRPGHPQKQRVTAWLLSQGFSSADHGERLQRRVR